LLFSSSYLKHVYDGVYDGYGTGANLIGYVETTNQEKQAASSQQTSGNIYGLDCEMCYTTNGLELARVSIVDVNFRDVYEAVVKPNAQILDYNTRWSGLTDKSFNSQSKSLKQVQNDLIKLFNGDTILIGHSLDSDFKALKLIHKTVVDTSVVFPHKMGPPYKRALRNLMSEILQKIIQEDGTFGWDFETK
jgi:RNA exonuclease 1